MFLLTMGSSFCHLELCYPRESNLLNSLSSLQGWLCDDIGPSEALMLLCSYENCTGKMTDPKELEDGSVQLKDLLTEEDFKMACLVIIILSLSSLITVVMSWQPEKLLYFYDDIMALNWVLPLFIPLILHYSYMTRKWRECELLKRLLSFFSITHLRRQLIWSRKLRSNITVSNLHIYSSKPGHNGVLGSYSSLISCVTHVYFLTFLQTCPLIPNYTTCGPWLPKMPR